MQDQGIDLLGKTSTSKKNIVEQVKASIFLESVLAIEKMLETQH